MKDFAKANIAILGTDFTNGTALHRRNSFTNLSLVRITGPAEKSVSEPATLPPQLFNGHFDAVVVGLFSPLPEHPQHAATISAIPQIRAATSIPILFVAPFKPINELEAVLTEANAVSLQTQMDGLRLSKQKSSNNPSVYGTLRTMEFRHTSKELAAKRVSSAEGQNNLWMPDESRLVVQGVSTRLTRDETKLINALIDKKWTGKEKLHSLHWSDCEPKILDVHASKIARKVDVALREAGHYPNARTYPIVSHWGFGLLLNPDLKFKVLSSAKAATGRHEGGEPQAKLPEPQSAQKLPTPPQP